MRKNSIDLKNIIKKIIEPKDENEIKSNVFDTRSFLPLRNMTTTNYYWELKDKRDHQLNFIAKDWITEEIIYTLILYLDYEIDKTKEETNSYIFLYDKNDKKVFQAIFINKNQREVGKNMSGIMKKPDFWAGKSNKIFR